MFRSTSGSVANARAAFGQPNDNEPAGRCYSQRSAARSQDAPVRGDVAEVPFVGERHKLVLSTPIWGGSFDGGELSLGQPLTSCASQRAACARCPGRPAPRTRLFRKVRCLTSEARWRSTIRSSFTGRGAIQVSGNRSVRSRCANVRASTRSFFNRAWAIALQARGGRGGLPSSSLAAAPPAKTTHRLLRTPLGPGTGAAQNFADPVRVVWQVPVEQLVATFVHHRYLPAPTVDG